MTEYTLRTKEVQDGESIDIPADAFDVSIDYDGDSATVAYLEKESESVPSSSVRTRSQQR